MSDPLLHWPPKRNPAYEREDDGLAALEWRAAAILDQIDGAEEAVASLDDLGQHDLAQAWWGLVKQLERDYREARDRFIERETGW